MANTSDEYAIQELVRAIESHVTYGTEPPGAATPGKIYIQYAVGSYSRLWNKNATGQWIG
jgi:hypothetical protein